MHTSKMLLAILILMCLLSCEKYDEFDNIAQTRWNPELAVPLINSSIAVSQILDRTPTNDDIIEVSNDNLITLIYKDEISSKKGFEILKISNLNDILTNTKNIFHVDFSSFGTIHNLLLNNGVLNYSIDQVNEELLVTIMMPFTTKNGSSFSESFVLNSNNSSGQFHLSNYNFDLTLNGSDANAIYFDHSISRVSDGIDVTNEYDININFTNLDFSFLSGHFNTYNFDIQNHNIPINIFKNWKEGEVRLENPQIKLNFKNSFGIPIFGEFQTLQGQGSNEGQVIESSQIDNGFTLAPPELTSSAEFENTTINLNKDNSNIQNFIAASPNSIKYALNFVGNVDVDTSKLDFMFDDSEFKLGFELILPMDGKIINAILVDTFDFSVEAEELFISTETAVFKLQTENKLPVNMSLQMYFLDDQNNVLDSLIEGDALILKSGNIDESGIVDEPGILEKFIEYNILSNTNKSLQNTRKIILKAHLDASNDGEPVKLYSDYYLNVKLGVISKINLN